MLPALMVDLVREFLNEDSAGLISLCEVTGVGAPFLADDVEIDGVVLFALMADLMSEFLEGSAGLCNV